MIVAEKPEYFDNRTDTITNPQIIIEVLSDSTQAYDREGKFQAYRTIPTFQEYLLIDQTKIYVEQFSKTGNKRWNLREYDEEDEMISLESVAFEISMQDLYNKVGNVGNGWEDWQRIITNGNGCIYADEMGNKLE